MNNYNRRKLLCAFLTALVLLVLTSSLSAQNRFPKTTDFDGDGKTDLAIFRNENGKLVWYVMQSTAGYRVFQWGLDTDYLAPGDYDGDGKTDLAIWRQGAPQCYYWIYGSQAGTMVAPFGVPNDLPLRN